jgi:hypothetical protein
MNENITTSWLPHYDLNETFTGSPVYFYQNRNRLDALRHRSSRGRRCRRALFRCLSFYSRTCRVCSVRATLEICNQPLRETKRKTDNEKCWISLPRSRKYSTAGDVEIIDGVYSAI